MIDNTRYISLLAASIYNTCYISRTCTLLSINAFVCSACITRVIHSLMHYVCMAGGAAPARSSTLACFCLCATGGVGAVGCTCWAMPSASLTFALSIALTIARCVHEWMEARPLYGESVHRLRHCEYFNKVGPYCWRNNVLIIYDNYCLDGYLLGCGMNYNLSNMKAPCDIYFRNRLPCATRDIVKILTRDAPVDGGASPL